jgi:hypothetical protein
MPDSFQRQREALRTRIARSRRRFERQASLVAHNPLRLTRYASEHGRYAGLWSTLAAGVGLAVTRGFTRKPRAGSWQHRLLGATLSAVLDQVFRRLRVLAWQAKRRRRRDDAGGRDE